MFGFRLQFSSLVKFIYSVIVYFISFVDFVAPSPPLIREGERSSNEKRVMSVQLGCGVVFTRELGIFFCS